MAFEYTPPKYAQIITVLQGRIESGEYPPGSLLPSEHQLAAEFGAARPTVVRALRVLRQEGWIDTQQGKGSFVRGRPALAGESTDRRGETELDRDESREAGELISAGRMAASERAAALLGVESGTELFSRKRLVRDDDEPAEVVTWWLVPDVAGQVGLDRPEPVPGGLRTLLDKSAGIRIDHVIERVAARRPEPQETKLLGLSRSAPVLAMYLSAREASGHPVVAVEVAMAGDLYELEEAYSLG